MNLAQESSGDELLEKVVWTDTDFDRMGRHDATVHAIAFNNGAETAEILIDLDYILRWTEPGKKETVFTFMVAPATLVFQDVWSLEGELGLDRTLLEISEIRRLDYPEERHRANGWRPWVLEGHDFELRFLASGFRQHFRLRPLNTGTSQRLSTDERRGFSFDQPTVLRK